jgi:hypothetical protein
VLLAAGADTTGACTDKDKDVPLRARLAEFERERAATAPQ